MQKLTSFIVHPAINATHYYAKPLEPIFVQLISHLDKVGEVVLLSSKPAEFAGKQATVIEGLADLWVRDFGVIKTAEGMFAPTYAPTYHREDEFDLRGGVEAFRKMFWPEAIALDLLLETGNFVSNGQVAILCDKVLRDNSITESDLVRRLEPLGLEELVLLPQDPIDEIGHADGTVCLLENNKLLFGFSPDLYDDPMRMKMDEARSRLSRWFDIVSLPAPYTPDQDKLSAVGCYVNLLNLPDHILVPTFGLPEDDFVLETIKANTNKQIYPIPASELAQHGGVLHCAVFEIHDLNQKESK